MDWEGKSIKVGAVVLCMALLLRLLAGGLWDKMLLALTSPQAVSAMLFLETGRVVRPGGESQPVETVPTPTETVATTFPTVAEPTVPIVAEKDVQAVFSAADAALVEVRSVCGYTADVEGGLTKQLTWDLTGEGPTVLIVHSHGTESYENTENYQESSGYRTKDPAYNMVSVGDRLVQILEQGGIKAVHDRQAHDDPSYSDSYNNSRKSIAYYLETYPTIRLVLDIHRDAVEDEAGRQMGFSVEVGDKSAAKLMLVVGSDAGGLQHPHWGENMSLAVKLHAQLEKNTPGICRPISFRSQRFNQDLSAGALIVEVGSAGNTRQEALTAVELLGQAIIDLSHGTVSCE
ncbi:MAG: stage II sporulation protein P [Oscillospiraceae bacterium]|nr:stage II sporulation protein P [Oscillospiraceae bacterium]